MRAMVYRGPYKVRMEEKERPRIEHPNDAIVRVQLAAICGSDLHLYHGMMPDTRIGHTFGHEFIGVVDEVGSSVRNLSVGEYAADWHDAFLAEMAPWVASGEVRYREDIREGLEIIPTAFAEMLRGENFGKTLVRVAPDPTVTSRRV